MKNQKVDFLIHICHFFLLVSLISIAKFMKKKSFISFLQVIVGFYICSLFHGPVAIGMFVFLFYLILTKLKEQLIKLRHLQFNIFLFLSIIILSIPIILFVNDNIKIPYIGSFNQLINIDYLINIANISLVDQASYPSWLFMNNGYEIFPKTIIKIFYFMYSPFVWDITELPHLVGLIDGILFLALSICIIQNWKNIWANPITRIFLLLLISYMIIYGFGLGNFGTVIRHRSKFVVILIILAAPMFRKFIFSTKKKLYNK